MFVKHIILIGFLNLQLPTGENSCYFDIAKSVLFTLAENNGQYNYNVICDDFKKNFFVKKDYDMKKRQEYMSRSLSFIILFKFIFITY